MSAPLLKESVCAILLGDAEVGRGADQVLPVEQCLAPGRGPHPLRDAVREAISGGCTWLWLLGPGVRPTPTALERLLAPLASLETLPAPALLVSRVLTDAGRPVVPASAWPRLTDKEVAVAGAEHGLVSIRAARKDSLLVRREAVERHGLPRARYEAWGDDIEWTARILAREAGYLAPASIAVCCSAPGANSAGRWRRSLNAADMLARGPWQGEERIWFSLVLAREIALERA